jgi:hypothetical protein
MKRNRSESSYQSPKASPKKKQKCTKSKTNKPTESNIIINKADIYGMLNNFDFEEEFKLLKKKKKPDSSSEINKNPLEEKLNYITKNSNIPLQTGHKPIFPTNIIKVEPKSSPYKFTPTQLLDQLPQRLVKCEDLLNTNLNTTFNSTTSKGGQRILQLVMSLDQLNQFSKISKLFESEIESGELLDYWEVLKNKLICEDRDRILNAFMFLIWSLKYLKVQCPEDFFLKIEKQTEFSCITINNQTLNNKDIAQRNNNFLLQQPDSQGKSQFFYPLTFPIIPTIPFFSSSSQNDQDFNFFNPFLQQIPHFNRNGPCVTKNNKNSKNNNNNNNLICQSDSKLRERRQREASSIKLETEVFSLLSSKENSFCDEININNFNTHNITINTKERGNMTNFTIPRIKTDHIIREREVSVMKSFIDITNMNNKAIDQDCQLNNESNISSQINNKNDSKLSLEEFNTAEDIKIYKDLKVIFQQPQVEYTQLKQIINPENYKKIEEILINSENWKMQNDIINLDLVRTKKMLYYLKLDPKKEKINLRKRKIEQ